MLSAIADPAAGEALVLVVRRRSAELTDCDGRLPPAVARSGRLPKTVLRSSTPTNVFD
jgi:hypothetical protein